QSMDAEALTQKFQDLELYSLIQHVSKFSDDIVEFETPDKNYKTIINTNDLDTMISELKKSALISFDLETTSINALQADIVGLSFSVKENEGWYIPVLYPEKVVSLFDEFSLSLILEKLKPLFEDAKVHFCGQNLKYDALVLSRYDVGLNGIVFDSMIAEHLLHPEKNSYKLDYLALDYLNYRMKPIEDLIGKGAKQISMADVPLEDIAFYATEDADVALQVALNQQPIIPEENLSEPFENIEMPLLPVLITMEENGVYLDLDFLKELSGVLAEKLDKLIAQIHTMAGHEFNLNSPQQLAVVLFDELELKPIRKRSTAVEVLEVLKSHHPLPEYILEYRHLAKLKNTYIDAFPNHVHPKTGRVHTSLNQTIAATGRLSSTNPNFQNIPIRNEIGREIRKAFCVQNPEHVMLSADYSQIELRIMADFSQEPALIEAFKNGTDIHTRTAALVFSVDESDVTADQRRTAKVVNFGIMYGAGPFRMSQELGISMADARKLIDTYFGSYPGIQKYMDDTLASAHENGFVKTRLGRKRKMTQLNSGNHNLVKAEERAAINMPIQGTAADLIKIAMINIHKKMDEENYTSKMILQIHDELLFEGPPEEMDKLSKLVVDEMEGAMTLSVPLKVDWKIGKNWYEAH
ncbi:MAG: DNA polymerase I, partial [Candidatus Marinimicrobia bacterium]|nr:DNA polymerase I [Candidatus Neomarinimicrobiota bacterium]